jgi:hypothetical protein
MTDEAPLNLNKARKERLREATKAQADANALKFGRTKAERLLEAARNDLARRRLDQHQFDEE